MVSLKKEEVSFPTGLNLKKLKEKFDQEKKSYEQKDERPKDTRFVRIPEGKTIVRILPPYALTKDEYFERFLNHRVGNSNIVCLREKKYTPVNICPVCKLVRVLYDTKNDADAKFAGEMRAKEKYYYNVLVREFQPTDEKKSIEKGFTFDVNPDEVKILSTGVKLYSKIHEYIFETEYGDITDINVGYDFVIVMKPIQIAANKSIPNYDNSYPKKDSSPLAGSIEKIKEVLGKAFNLRQIVEESRKTPAEMTTQLENYLNSINAGYMLDLMANKDRTQVAFTKNPFTKQESNVIDIAEINKNTETKSFDVGDESLKAFEEKMLSDMENGNENEND